MSRNGSGTYTLPAGNPVVTGTTISSTWANNSLSDIATALTQSLAKDGQTTPTANIPMGSFKLTGLGAPTTAGDALAYGSPMGAISGTTGTFSGNVQMASLNGGAVSLRNKIINGNMGIFQRGTTAVTTGATYGPADRWVTGTAGNTFSTTQGSFVSGDTLFDTGGAQFFTQIAVTSVAGASNSTDFSQKIEDVRLLAGQTVTVSFWAKAASGTPSIGVEVRQNFGTGGSTTVTGTGQAQALTTTWAQYTKTFTVPSINGKTVGTANTHFTQLVFWLDAGSTLNTVSGSIGQSSKTVSIAQVQVEIGPVATPFEQRPIGLEYSLCARYYWTQTSAQYAAYMVQNDSVFWTGSYGVPMRTVPSITYSGGTLSPATVTIGFVPTAFGYVTNLSAGASGTTTPGRHYIQGATLFANAEL